MGSEGEINVSCKMALIWNLECALLLPTRTWEWEDFIKEDIL